MSTGSVAILVLGVLFGVLLVALAIAVRASRRRARSAAAAGTGDRRRRRRRAAITTALGRDLQERSLRIDAVISDAEQARTLGRLADAVVLDEMARLAGTLIVESDEVREQLVSAAPLSGPSRAYALSLVEPRIEALEAAGRALVAIAEEASAARPIAVPDELEAVRREANALEAALAELTPVAEVQRSIEALLESG